MAEGAELIRCALDAGVPVESVYVSPEGGSDGPTQEVCRRATAAGARVFPLAAGVLERVADTVTPAAGAGRRAHAGRGRLQPTLTARPGSLLMVLVDVRDPGNAGTVLRAADASGATAVLFAADSVDPYNPKTVRASAGSLFHIPFAVRRRPAGAWPKSCRRRLPHAGDGRAPRRGLRRVRLVRAQRRVPGQRVVRTRRRALRSALDGALAIPMEGRAESLNVGVASAVVGFEAARQRRVGAAGARSISSTADEERHGLRHGD